MANKNRYRVVDITFDDIFDYQENVASLEDSEWISARMEYWETKKENGRYFSTFRAEFAERFFPELFSEQKKKQSTTGYKRAKEIHEKKKAEAAKKAKEAKEAAKSEKKNESKSKNKNDCLLNHIKTSA